VVQKCVRQGKGTNENISETQLENNPMNVRESLISPVYYDKYHLEVMKKAKVTLRGGFQNALESCISSIFGHISSDDIKLKIISLTTPSLIAIC